MWIILKILIFNIGFVFEALWHKEAYQPGPSNHIYLVVWITTWFLLLFVTSKSTPNFRQFLMICVIYLTLKFGIYDYLLNHFRGFDFDYTGTGDYIYKNILDFLGGSAKWFKTISLIIGMMILPYMYHKEDIWKRYILK